MIAESFGVTMVKDDKYSDKEFDSEEEMHLYWAENHMDDLNSHDKDKAKKALRDKDESEKQERERKRNLAFKVTAGGVAVVLAVVLIPQLLDAADIGASSTNATFTLEDQPFLGDEDADVDVVYFNDFYCPACKSFNDGVKPQLEENYIDTGDITFYIMDFPLNFHDPQATAAAVTSQCTYVQDADQFWDVHDALFDVQRNIDYSPDRLTQLVEDNTEGLDYEEVQSCIADQDTLDSVDQDLREGLDAGVQGTPTLFVNGQEASDFAYGTLSSMIDEELEAVE